MMGYLKFCFFLFAVCLSANCVGQSSAEKFSQSADLKGALVSVSVADFETGAVLQAANEDQRLCPASVWKLFTTTAALKTLGSEFRFRTVLAYDGKIENGILSGNLYIIGGGDPALGSRHFSPGFEPLMLEWASAVKAAGIDSVNGKIVANAAHFQGDGIPRTRIWEDMGNYYGAAVSGLNINDNTFYVDFQVPSDIGREAKILSIDPAVPGLQINSEVVSSTIQSDRAFIFGSPYSNERIVRGTLPAGRDHFKIKGSLPNPPVFAASHLQKALKKIGIGSGGLVVEQATLREPATYRVIREEFSPSLSALVKHTNVESDNLYAETFLYQIGVKNGDGTLMGGLESLEKFYEPICEKEYPLYAYDGSGLSRFTAVSASQITTLIQYCAKDEMLRKDLLGNLPLAGEEGSMKWFGKRTNLAGNLRGKSGSMDKVRAYAGYFAASSGRKIAFAVVVNNFDGSGTDLRQKIETMLLEVYGDY
ncbi:D-alanyl-D-alanine carboxypeptidase/D-alanyl-D-alanine-endopeptidase [Cryomorpha ignava]|uniref:D-alanyl-D-alanine carboxypeptidase/D-alanyl-D-alanine-endopeptidase n=1 Tax=Cryomorpha ignava TaxID=101383 RepID=A0A7K3WS78_9FLAO|nr:D-alanyl-D-alanine carboxypeptidase/D-alanyl-D-alanine-endopeptidase [Cryomorpha ignava]NEN24368.1 D-alanyl-D-alanine carboxypeptidase/D-alanyl-D-alanine-endopeptidase [Cryomorpha ignava]